MPKIAVIGCGASGIATASELNKYGFDVEIFEKEEAIGGRMRTSALNGKRVCLGGKNIGKKYTNFLRFCRDHSVTDFEEFGLNSSNGKGKNAKTFDNNRLLKSILQFMKGLPLRDIWRLAPIILAVKKNRENAYLSGTYFKKFNQREFQDKTLSTYFSKALHKRMLRPLVVRNNGAEPDEVSLANFGTNIAMVLDSYVQLSDGPDKLFENFSKTAKIHYGVGVKRVIKENTTIRGIELDDGRRLPFDGVVLATPASVSASILKKECNRLANLLKKIRYFPVGVVVAQYEQPLFNATQRAWTFPADAVLSNVGCYGKNELDIVRYTFSGRVSRSLLQSNPSVETLIELAEKEVKKHTHLKLSKRLGYVGKVMQTGLCAYSPQHTALLENINKEIQIIDGLYLSGDYWEGVSIEGCFLSGIKTAKLIEETFEKRVVTV